MALYYFTFRYASEIKLPVLQDMVGHFKADESRKNAEYTRQNLDAMAVKLGEMQAQLSRLDALGDSNRTRHVEAARDEGAGCAKLTRDRLERFGPPAG